MDYRFIWIVTYVLDPTEELCDSYIRIIIIGWEV
jgi:hypothetical protein